MRCRWIVLGWIGLLIAAPSLATPPKKGAVRPKPPTSGKVEKIPVQMDYTMPKGFKPSQHPVVTPIVAELNRYRENLKKSKQLKQTIIGLLDLHKRLKAKQQSVSPLVWWEVYFGLGVGHAYSGPAHLLTAERYFRRALPYTRSLDRMKAAETYYNIACALSLRSKVTESLRFLKQSFIEEDKVKVDAHFRASQLDETLANVRKDPRYRALMNRYALKKPTVERKVQP